MSPLYQTLRASVAFEAMYSALVAADEAYDPETDALQLDCPTCAGRNGTPRCVTHLREQALELAREVRG